MSEIRRNKPHIRIPRDKIRHERRRFRKPPLGKEKKKDFRENGRALINQLNESVKYCRRPQKIIEDEDFLLILQTEKSIRYQERMLKRFNFTQSLQLDEYSAIVSLDGEILEKFRNALQRYIETASLRSYINQIAAISIPDFNRVSPELTGWLESSNGPAYVEIEMLPNLKGEKYTRLIRRLTSFLKKRGDEVLSQRIREEAAFLRAYVKPQTAKMIVQGVDSVWQTRQGPRIVAEKPKQRITMEPPIPRPPDPDVKNICVLDTGIDLKHPFFQGVLSTAVDLTPDNTPYDEDGHGTFVAGLAAYGILENRAHPKASARIVSAKILEKNPLGQFLEDRLEQAVQQFYTQAKIFSLSVMYDNVCNTFQPTNLAYTIDKLSHEYDVLFVICTGNIEEKLNSLITSLPYPEYLRDRCCRIYSGAEACTAVTVGGVANKDSDNSIANIGEPSPFTRRGEIGERAKPDVVSWAGNIVQPRSRSPEVKFDAKPELSVISLALSPEILTYGIGTSFAAPIVANLLTKLSMEYPDASNNLLKALLVHFSRWPDQHLKMSAGEDLKKALYGKGIPEFDRCAYSTMNCATYITEDSVNYDEVAFVPLYVPKCMRNIYGEKRMRVTLVYDPPVDRGVLGYSLVDLSIQLFKEFKKQRNWDRTFRRQWDNVKTDLFRWQKSGWGKEWTIMVFPRVRFPERIANLNGGSQRFALVVSLEDPSKKINIYDAIISETMKIKPLEAYIQAASA